MESVSFSKIAIVSCGTLSLELNYLKQTGVLDTDHLYFTTPEPLMNSEPFTA